MGRQKTVTPEQRKQYHKEWREKNREKWNAYGAKWYKKNSNKRSIASRKWDELNPEKRKEISANWYAGNKNYKSEEQRIRLLKYKTMVVEAYGGRCSCCGEKEIGFLTVEHLQKNGESHRKVRGNFYHYLVRNNFPDKDILSILCMNCNWIERNGRVCPHRAEKSVSTSAVAEPSSQDSSPLTSPPNTM